MLTQINISNKRLIAYFVVNLFFLLIFHPIAFSQIILDGTFDGTSTWGNPIHQADGIEGWAATNCRSIYLVDCGDNIYIGVDIKASSWMSWALAINTKSGGGSDDSWSRAIDYGYTDKPDFILRGTFDNYSEFHTWDGNQWTGIGSPQTVASIAEGITGNDEDTFLEIRLSKSAIGDLNNIDMQFYLTGDVANEHGTFDAIPDDEVADTWDESASRNVLDNYLQSLTVTPIVSLTPSLPLDDQSFTITFDPTCTALESASKVYLHSGVSTTFEDSMRFDKTIGNWGQDDGVGEMTLSGGIWTITIPSMRNYYQVTDYEDIFGLNYLFRSADGSTKVDNNGNNYYNSIDRGEFFLLDSPDYSPFLVSTSDSFDIEAHSPTSLPTWTIEEVNTTDSSSIQTIFSTSNNDSISHRLRINTVDEKLYKITADFGVGNIKSKFIQVNTYNPVNNISRPNGMQPGINYHSGDPTKATLILHAPTYTRFKKGNGTVSGMAPTTPKNVVHVVGDFNGWQISEAYKMNRDTDGWDGNTDADGDGDRGDYWWITLENLVPGQEYVYQYLIDGQLQVGDPYCEKVSDFDDQYIENAVYPDLIAYPSANAVDRASVLQTDQTDYTWTAPPFSKPSITKLHIYELHFRDFTEEGTYLAAIDRLDYIKSLGINAIHVLPVSEFEGNSSWGYNPNFYFAPDKAYGKAEDLKKFIDECHKREIQVFNDVVLNHAFYSNVMARMYWNEALNRPADDSPFFNPEHKMVANPAGWWGADWNHESEHVQAMVDRIIDFWLQEYRFDGFRFDFTKGIGQSPQNPNDEWASNRNDDRIALLERMVNGMKSRNPGSVVIFEHLAAAEEDKILADQGILMWSGVGHHNDVKGFILGYNADNTNIYDSGVYNATTRNFNSPHWMSYPESHDEQRLAYELDQFGNGISNESDPVIKVEKTIDRLKLGWAFNLFLPGPRMIWQFGELGYDVDIDFNGRTGEKPVKWDYYDDPKRKELYRLFSKILKIRNTHDVDAIINYGNIGLGAGNITTPRYMKLADNFNHQVIVLGNLDPDNGHNAAPGYPVTGTWYKYNGDPTVDGTSFMVTDVNSTYFLQASETVILTNFLIDDCSFVDKNIDTDVVPNTLRSAVSCAQPDDTLTLAFPIYNDTIKLQNKITIDKNLSILTDTSTAIVLDARGSSEPFISVEVGNTLHLRGISIICDGGTNINCIENDGTIIAEDVNFWTENQVRVGNNLHNGNLVIRGKVKVEKLE